jgi:hypothetical protein
VLRRSQNPDGGWGYFSGKASWIEPTAYAALALHGEPAADRAWALLRSWQLPDGSWPPSAGVKISSWGTSLCATIAMARNEWDAPLQKGIAWLVGSSGVESNWLSVLVSRIGLVDYGRDVGLKSWPWKPGNSGWVEPTVHAIVALKVALKMASANVSGSGKVSGPGKVSDKDLRERIRIGEAELLDVRGRDGGWNYGSPVVLGVDLPSYPETTALALVALQGHAALQGHVARQGHSDLSKAFDLALRQIGETPSPLARAWLTIAMRLHGMDAKAPELTGPPPPDLAITALEALAAPDGNHRFMKTTALSGGAA